jgi:hypothetical protein
MTPSILSSLGTGSSILTLVNDAEMVYAANKLVEVRRGMTAGRG